MTLDEIIKSQIEELFVTTYFADELSEQGMKDAIQFVKEQLVKPAMLNMTADTFNDFDKREDNF